MHIPQSDSAHAVLDRVPEENHECPWTRQRIREFQRKLDKIAGISSNGRPNVRLIWPADTDESISMHIVNGEKRARYKLYTQVYECKGLTPSGIETVQNIDVDITLPRFVIEEFHEPWEEAFNPAEVENKGQGYYTHLWTCAYHDEKCCGGYEATQAGELCLGLYREPGERDLEELKRRIHLRDSEKRYRAVGERVTNEEAIAAARETRSQMENVDAKRRAEYYGALMDSFNTHGFRLFTDDPSVLKHGKYHFLTGAKK